MESDFGAPIVARGEGWTLTLDTSVDPPRLELTLRDPDKAELRLEAGRKTQLTVRLPADFADEVLKNKRAMRPRREDG